MKFAWLFIVLSCELLASGGSAASRNSRVLNNNSCGENQPLNILLTNDDGFDVANIQALFTALKGAGHNVLLVAPYGAQSGKSASVENVGVAHTSKFAGTPLAALEVGATTDDSECGTVKAGAPPLAMVSKSTTTGGGDDEYYIVGPPAVSVFYGLDIAGPAFFKDRKEIDLVISGPNTAPNFGFLTSHSGTVGAAVTAMNRGHRGIAFSAGRAAGVVDHCNPTQYNPDLIAALALKVIDSVTCGDKVTLEPSTGLNVNIPSTNGKTLEDLENYKFEDTEISVSGGLGVQYFSNLLDCRYARAVYDARGVNQTLLEKFAPLPGLCFLSSSSEMAGSEVAGYPADTNAIGEFNTVSGDPEMLTVSISKIQSTYQAVARYSPSSCTSSSSGSIVVARLGAAVPTCLMMVLLLLKMQPSYS
mmetsp:Transcript_9285/g.19862  ORF Transcript_9285/g.19862 Transcript_9285/m.19862 type:complete len:418 (+) Transcript_9285:86-1339(+)